MTAPKLSDHFKNRKPSSIRVAQLKFLERTDGTEDVNVAIGNVSLPMHPAMIDRMRLMGSTRSPAPTGRDGPEALTGGETGAAGAAGA